MGYVSSAAQSGGSSTTNTLTITNFVITGNLLLVKVGHRGSDQSVSGITWNGTEALTKLDNVSSGTNETKAEIWYLKNPTVKTANIVISLTGAVYVCATAMDISGADVYGTTFGAVSKDGSVSLSSSLSVAATVGDLLVDILAKKVSDTTDGTISPNGTLRQTSKTTNATDTNNIYIGISTQIATTNPQTMSWSWTSGNRYKAQIGVAVKPAPGPAGIKTVNGIAIASVKTINGVAIANVKSIQGLT